MPNVVPNTLFRFTTLPLLRRSYGSKFAWRAHRKPLPVKVQPTMVNEDGTRTLRLRPNMGAGRSALPLPPVMDPIVIAAKQRHRSPKLKAPRKGKKMSEFSKALAANPFAQALATPVRNCSVTNARLPSHFLQQLSCDFRVEGGRLKGYIDVNHSSNDISNNLESELGSGYSIGQANRNGYFFNSRQLMQVLGRKKRNRYALVYRRLKEAYDERARALSAQTGINPNPKGFDPWDWLGSEEQSQSILINDVLTAFKAYKEKVPALEHLVPLSRLEGVPYEIVSSPLARRPRSTATQKETVDAEDVDQTRVDDDVLVPAYDLRKLQITREQLERLDLESKIINAPVLGILQNKQTLKLHLALQRLLMFIGEELALRWLVVKREDWQISILQGHDVISYGLMSGKVPDSQGDGFGEDSMDGLEDMNGVEKKW